MPWIEKGLNAGWSIPRYYGEDILVLMPRDPRWLFAYWEIAAAEKARQPDTLRVYRYKWEKDDVESWYDVDLPPGADNWYLEVGVADRFYHVEIGRKTHAGFDPLLRSNKVRTPRESVSEIIDENWCLPHWQSRRLFRRISLSHLSSAELSRSRYRLTEQLKKYLTIKENHHA